MKNDEIPEEVIDLVRFLASTWHEVDSWARSNMTEKSIGTYPVIQGTRNQMNLAKISEQKYNKENIKKAVDWMLKELPEPPSERNP